MVSTLGLTRSNGNVSQAGNSSTSPGGQELGEVVGELPGHRPGGHGDDERATAPAAGQRGEHERPGRLGHGEHRVERAVDPRQRRFVAQELGQGTEGGRVSLMERRQGIAAAATDVLRSKRCATGSPGDDGLAGRRVAVWNDPLSVGC